jgi:hypothetical protein
MTRKGFVYVLHKDVRLAAHSCPSLERQRVLPQVLRHTCAVMILQATGDLGKVSLWLGHADMQTMTSGCCRRAWSWLSTGWRRLSRSSRWARSPESAGARVPYTGWHAEYCDAPDSVEWRITSPPLRARMVTAGRGADFAENSHFPSSQAARTSVGCPIAKRLSRSSSKMP